MENKKVLVGMSGGVDSSVSALLLKNQGYEVIGVTLQLWEKNGEETEYCDVKKICEQLDIKHYITNEKDNFKKCVIDDFICAYSNCKTPNPCIECNKYFKFGSMHKLALQLGVDYIATGHYARTEYSEKYGRIVLKKSSSEKKDQSYVLYSIDKQVLPYLIFPLADFKDKGQIRQIARDNELKVANKPDSEDICFIPDGDYKKFLEENSNLSPKPGNIVDKQGFVLGKHNGLYKYTIGQRKGLGISHPTPLFVVGFNSKRNEVIVGEHADLFQKELNVEEINLLAIDKIIDGMEVQTKIRYATTPINSRLYKNENGTIKVIFDEAVRGATPGQSAVFYDEDIVIGGGKICQ